MAQSAPLRLPEVSAVTIILLSLIGPTPTSRLQSVQIKCRSASGVGFECASMRVQANGGRVPAFAKASCKPLQRSVVAYSGRAPICPSDSSQSEKLTSRRALMGVSAAVLSAACADQAQAVQGLTAGRVPGERPDPDNEGFNIYQRPIGKSGGHGVGWSEIPQVRHPNTASCIFAALH